jgi:competence protein ComEC
VSSDPGKARERTTSWPLGGRRAGAWHWPASWARQAQTIRAKLVEWTQSDVAPGRLLPWLPVAFGAGIALYFAAETEPSIFAVTALALACVTAAILLRRRALGFPLALAGVALFAGFAVATWRSAHIAHPVLAAPVTLTIGGWVEVREERESRDRIVVQVQRAAGARDTEMPQRVRVAVRKGTAPPVGAFVEMRARLSPPLEPLRPGGYDFARDLYFQKIGGSGFVLGQIRIADPPAAQTWRLRYAAAVDAMRDAIDKRIRSVVPGDEGAIASALITGKRDAISKTLNDAMYISSLAHVLSISGYHMALVAGVVFFLVRASFALFPAFASRYPIKKFAAVIAFAVAAFYLVLSGAEVATQRSFIMLSIILLAVVLDRTALTLRTLAIAAFIVMLIAPEAVVHPSFQMSFAATLALVATYAGGMAWGRPEADDPLHVRAALWGGRQIAALILASLVAGLATTPYAAYHFHRAAPYGVLANLLAMPIVSLWVMPAGLAGVFTLPFGFDAFWWRAMGEGIRWMDAVALWVAGLPGAVGRISAFGIGPLLLGTAGLLLICLLRSPLRWCGGLVIAGASLWAINTPVPDAFIASDGRVIAARGSDGRLAAVKTGNDSFALREWLAADGDARAPTDTSLSEGARCDGLGCTVRLADGRLIALALSPEAFADDCRRAAVVVTPGHGPATCAAMLSDQQARQRTGATTLRRAGDGLVATPTRPPGYDRPWARAIPSPENADSAAQRAPLAARDATPRAEDLEPGD